MGATLDELNWCNKDGVNHCTASLNQHIPQYCGSCWAHGAISAFQDRIKMDRINNGVAGDDIVLSVQHVLNCGSAGSFYVGWQGSLVFFCFLFGSCALFSNGSITTGSRSLITVFLLIVFLFLGLNLLPLELSLNGMLERSVCVTLAVVTDTSVPPEGVKAEGAQHNIGVPEFVVLTDPSSGESPETFVGRGGTETGDLLSLPLKGRVRPEVSGGKASRVRSVSLLH